MYVNNDNLYEEISKHVRKQ